VRIALDATYSLGDALSGVGVYSRELLTGLAASGSAEGWDWFYRSQRYLRARLTRTPAKRPRAAAVQWQRRQVGSFIPTDSISGFPNFDSGKQVSTFHDLFVLSGDYSTADFRERFAAQARDAAAASDLIIAVSAFTASQVEHYLKVPASRIRVIHHGVLPRPVSGSPAPREKVILCVGAIQKRKNQITLVRALRAAPKDWTLVLAGSDGYEAEALRQEVKKQPAR